MDEAAGQILLMHAAVDPLVIAASDLDGDPSLGLDGGHLGANLAPVRTPPNCSVGQAITRSPGSVWNSQLPPVCRCIR